MSARFVWIVGASPGGLGAALAGIYSAQGAKVVVSARSADKLAEISETHPNIFSAPLDVTDRDSLPEVVQRVRTQLGGLDLVIYCAAIWHPMNLRGLEPATIEKSLATNFIGAVNVLAATLPLLREEKDPQIVLVSSVAGYRGLPKSAAYGPSKAALINFAEGLRPELNKEGISLSVVNCGFIETPMTAENDFPMPFILSVDDAAQRLVTAVESRKFEISFPKRMTFFMKMLRNMPYALFFWLVKRYMLPKN
ncbi:MAG: SDR family NAD(P)-dependent oxidoreductase [Stappiaceae bacterium]